MSFDLKQGHAPSKTTFLPFKSLSKALLCACALSAVSAVAAPPPKAAMCNSCHGKDGAAPIADSYPKLNGQNKAYLVSALQAYKTGNRKGGMAAAMAPQAAMLTDEEIEALSAYYSAVK